MTTLQVGQQAKISTCFSEEDVKKFAALSKDFNPVHLDADFAAQTPFGKQIVHGALVSSLFSGLLGQELPGEGTIYLGQNTKFRKPVFIDQTITASVEISSIRADKPIITLKTEVRDEAGKLLVSGEAVVLYEPS